MWAAGKKRMSVISKEHSMGELLFETLLLVCLWSCCYATVLQFNGNITIYGMFPLHNVDATVLTLPQLADCNRYDLYMHTSYRSNLLLIKSCV